MLKRIVALSLGVLALQVSHPCYGAVATWTFESGGDTTGPDYNADAGSLSGSVFTVNGGSPGIIIGGGNPGDALGIPSSTTSKLHIFGTGLYGFILTYDAKVDSGSPAQSWSYNYTAGPGYTTVGVTQPSALGTSWTTYTVDFSSITALDNQTEIWFKYGSSGSAVSFDNIEVVALIPEPANVALALFGLCGVGGLIARRAYAWVKS